jgi:hypothetical protein
MPGMMKPKPKSKAKQPVGRNARVSYQEAWKSNWGSYLKVLTIFLKKASVLQARTRRYLQMPM